MPLVFILSEAGGYTARLMFAQGGGALRNKFLAELIIIILAPNIAQAFLYVVTARLINAAPIQRFFLTRRSWWLPTFFVVADLACLIIQSIGGAQQANLDDNSTSSERKSAGYITLAGLAAQLAFLALFVVIFAWLNTKILKALGGQQPWAVTKVIIGIVCAVALVTVRNTYRVAEFAESLNTQHPDLGKKERYYLAGDALPMLILGCVFVFAHLEDARVFERLVQHGDGKDGAADEAVPPAENGSAIRVAEV